MIINNLGFIQIQDLIVFKRYLALYNGDHTGASSSDVVKDKSMVQVS